MNKFILNLVLLSFLSTFTLSAQSGWTIYNTSNSALMDNGIKTLSIDHNNRKWVGCTYGLGVYNDTAWTIFTTSNSGLPDDNIVSVNIDKNNAAWIGTNNGGLAKFDGTSWTVWNTMNSNLPSDEIKCIAFDTSGNKWIGTANGLVKFDDTTFTVWNLNNTSLFLVDIHAIAIDKNNVKYISSLNSGLFYLQDTTFTHYTVTNSYLQDNFVLSIAIDSSQNRWFGTAGKGFMSQHTDSITWEWYYPTNTPADSAWTVNCILIDSLQHKYTGTDLTGLVKYDGTKWTYWKTNNSPIPSNKVKCIAQEQDAKGVIWIGTDNGLARLESFATGIQPEDQQLNVEVYPNPANDKIHLFINPSIDGTIYLEIFDAIGITHQKVLLTKGDNLIHLSENMVASGLYFYRLFQNGSFGATNKLIINR